jgi:hypothetical protein
MKKEKWMMVGIVVVEKQNILVIEDLLLMEM